MSVEIFKAVTQGEAKQAQYNTGSLLGHFEKRKNKMGGEHMFIFVKPGSQVIVGNKYLPQQVISGPARVLLLGRRLHGQLNTGPRWLTLTSQELVTAGQVPVIFCISCTWSRNLAGFSGSQLYCAVQMADEQLEAAIRKNLEVAAAYYASFYQVEALVARPEADQQQIRLITANRRHLAQGLTAGMKQRLGGVGLVMGKLEVSVVLPERLQREVEDLWRLHTYNGHMPQLTQLRLARALAQGRVTINLIDPVPTDSSMDPVLGDYFAWPAIEAATTERLKIKGPAHPTCE